MRKSLRSTDSETTIIEKDKLFDDINDFNKTIYNDIDESQKKGKPYTSQQQSLIENFLEENHYISVFPLLQAFNSVNAYPNKEIIELLLNTCLNNNDKSVVNEACGIIENIACIPGIYDYEKLNKPNKNKELPFEFIANEDELFNFNNIISIMKNSLGNIKGYEKLNKDDEHNEVLDEINKELFNIVRYKETRRIKKPANIYLFFHTILTILKNDILQNQNLMKKTLLYRIIKGVNLKKLLINICELYDYTTFHDFDEISFIQYDIQLFIYMVSLYSYTKPKSSGNERNYLINREEIINTILANTTEGMLITFIETIIDNKVKQGIIERILQNKCNYEGRRSVPLHIELNENKILAYCLNFIPLDQSCKGYLIIVRILFLLIQSYIIDHKLTKKHKSEWINVLKDVEEIATKFSKETSVEPEEIKYEKELFNYYYLFKIIIMNYFDNTYE